MVNNLADLVTTVQLGNMLIRLQTNKFTTLKASTCTIWQQLCVEIGNTTPSYKSHCQVSDILFKLDTVATSRPQNQYQAIACEADKSIYATTNDWLETKTSIQLWWAIPTQKSHATCTEIVDPITLFLSKTRAKTSRLVVFYNKKLGLTLGNIYRNAPSSLFCNIICMMRKEQNKTQNKT